MIGTFLYRLAENFGKKTNYLSNKYCGKNCYKSPEVTSKKENFNAKSNDIWCVGVCLFMMLIGSCPWQKTNINDPSFKSIVIKKEIKQLLLHWKRLNYVNKHILNLFNDIFQFEEKRINLQQIKRSKWLNSK